MRKQNWEQLLASYLDVERKRPFVWGDNDCLTFAAKAAILVLATDRSQELEAYGNYDEKAANEIIERYGSLASIFDRHFLRRINHAQIKRGDICLVEINGQTAAGILDTTGRKVACKTLTGIISVPTSKIKTVWNIETWSQ